MEKQTFEIDKDEQKKLDKWIKEHDTKCSVRDSHTAIGGRLTYCFTPTSIGTSIAVKCVCGTEIDLTDYKKW